MANIEKHRLNPISLIQEYFPDEDISHIEYDPEMRQGQYNIRAGQSHDGTLYFTKEMLRALLWRLVSMQTSYIPTEPNCMTKVKSIHYRIGPIRHAICHGMVQLPASNTHKYPGLSERIRIPVSCEYVTEQGAIH